MLSRRWNWFTTGFWCLLVVGLGGQSPLPQKPLPEASVKAAFVLRFPEFVAWPNTRPAPKAPAVCLSPSHPFGGVFEKTAAAAPPRPTIHVLGTGEPLRQCDVLYVAPPDMALLAEAATLPILTVGDQPDFCQKGGIINLLVIDGRVRFEVGLAQAARVGLRVDSQLLRLATRVHGGHR
jgi:hypothetical protein